jgi:hypothetical protein
VKNLCLFKICTLNVLLQSKPEGDCSMNGRKRKQTEKNGNKGAGTENWFSDFCTFADEKINN